MPRPWTATALALCVTCSACALAATPAASGHVPAPSAETTVPVLIVGDDSSQRTIDVPTAKLGAALRELRRDRRNDIVEVDQVRRTQAVGAISDVEYPTQWGLPAIRWPESARTAVTATLAIVDTGVDTTHRDFLDASDDSRFIGTWNVHTNSSLMHDDAGHGTAVASVAGASSNGSFGMVGVAPNAPMLAVRLASPTGEMHVSDEIAAIDWAVAHGAKVINLSVGGTEPSNAERAAVDDATAAGVLLVAAAGNEGCTPANPTYFPAGYAAVLAVGAINSVGATPCFSSRGSHLDLAAPGTNITVARAGDTFAREEGTSFASPHVAGAAALLAGAHPTWTPAELANTLRMSAIDVGVAGWDPSSGWGVLNVTAALAATEPLTQPVPAPTPAPAPDPTPGPAPAPAPGPAPDPAPDPAPALPAPPPAVAASTPPAGPAPTAHAPTIAGPPVQLPTPAPNPPPPPAPARAQSGDVASGSDAFEPNDTFTRVARTATALDVRTRTSASLRASIAVHADPVDIYTGTAAARAPGTTLTVRLGGLTTKPTRVRIDVLTHGRHDRPQLRCTTSLSAKLTCALPPSTSRFWVRVTALAGSTPYRLVVSR